MKSAAASKYPTLTADEIKNLEIVSEIRAKDCVLFLWATVPMLEDALDVMRAWGFEYKTLLVWRKIMSLGMGYWFRGQVELCLLGVRGHVKAFRCQHANFWCQAHTGARGQKNRGDERVSQDWMRMKDDWKSAVH